MLQNSFYAISGTFYTLVNNTNLYLSYFILSYVFLGHNDSVEWGLTVLMIKFGQSPTWFDIYSENVKSSWRLFQIFVAFLENLNFTWVPYDFSKEVAVAMLKLNTLFVSQAPLQH